MLKIRVYIIDIGVEDRSHSEPDIIYSYYILGRLESGKELVIIEDEGFDLSGYKDKWVECLIYAAKGSEEAIKFLEGKFIHKIDTHFSELEKFRVPISWSKNYTLKKSLEGFYGIEINDGIFLIGYKNNFKNGQKIKYYVGEYKLSAWHPIDE